MNILCEFHDNYDHITMHFSDLKNKVKDLVRNHYLNEYVDGLFPLADEQ